MAEQQLTVVSSEPTLSVVKSEPSRSSVRPVDASEPGTYWGGFGKSVADTASKTGHGIVEGALDAVNPMSYVRGATNLAADLALTHGINTGEGVIQGVKAIASGDPTAGGHAIGNLAMGGVVGRGLGMLRGVMTPTPPETIQGVPLEDIKAAGVGDAAINATRNGRTPLKFPQPTPKPPMPSGPMPETSGNLALKPDESVAEAAGRIWRDTPSPSTAPTQPLGTPRVIAYKNFSDNLAKGVETPWSASSQFGPNAGEWASGETPGSAEALQASGLHRETAAMDSRFKYLMDSPNGFGARQLVASPGRTLSAAAGSWIAHKLGLPAYMGGAAGYMAPEIGVAGAQAATSPAGAAALRAAIMARLTSGTPDTSAGPR